MEASAGLDVEVHVTADSTWYRESLNIEGMPLLPNVRILGAGNYEELRRLYSRALFVVVPLLDVRYACGYGAPSDLVADGGPSSGNSI